MTTTDDAKDLPPLVEEFFRTGASRAAAAVLCRLHGWLAAKHLTISALDPITLRRFLQVPFRKVVTPRTATAARRGLFAYLDWLYHRGYLEYDARGLVMRRYPLSIEARAFLDSLAPTHRPSTCNGYQSNLRRFCAWQDDARVPLHRLRRHHMEQWLLALHDRKLHPSTVNSEILAVRSYLWWLAEHGYLRAHPDDLIRSSDLPKLPSYLPRPLPPEVDRELQERLAASYDSRWRGLLLMRHTGLRIGELISLEYDCVRVDPQGRRSLKVPLGKLNSERLVPLNDQSVRLIERLQSGRPLPHTYLLERGPGRPMPYAQLAEALAAASKGLDGQGKITTHRLRHTYATALLAGGMSLFGIMKLLGHRDHRMTLRYAAITQDVVEREYRAAVQRLEDKYSSRVAPHVPVSGDPLTAITDALAWLQNHAVRAAADPRTVPSLTRRLRRIQAELQQLLDVPEQ